METYNIFNDIKKLSTVCIIGHRTPDADALCSMILVKHFLESKYKVSHIDFFAHYDTLPNNYLDILEGVELNSDREIKQYDYAISVDCSSLDLIDKYSDKFISAKQKIVIDHHATNKLFGDINIVEQTSSTCELLYKILKFNSYDFQRGDYGRIYAGILTDTNNLTVGNINNETFNIVGECSKHIDIKPIYKHFMANNTLKNMQVMSIAINNISSHHDGKILITHITKADAERYHILPDDYLGIVNRLAGISGSQLVCFIQPRDDCFYVSMRAVDGFDVSKIATDNNGGGHTGAAAFNSTLSIAEIENLILESFEKELSTKFINKVPIF